MKDMRVIGNSQNPIDWNQIPDEVKAKLGEEIITKAAELQKRGALSPELLHTTPKARKQLSALKNSVAKVG